MKLIQLTLRNFKGVKEFTLNAAGESIRVFGDNATGKTTIFDAFTWLLFDKDSSNRKDFQIKTLDAAGQPVSGLNHEVEAIIQDGHKTVSLGKSYSEKWTKARGSATATFSGHTTDYSVDGVPVKKKDFDSKVAEIAKEDAFKLLTSPSFFNEQVHWQDRRKLLLEVCGDIGDAEVISSDKKLEALPKILNGKSLEDHRKIIQSKQAAINKELKEIPARIDEVQRGLPDTSGLSREVLEVELASLKKQQQAKQQEIIRIQNGGEVAQQQKLLREVESRLLDIQNQFKSENQDRSFEKKSQLQKLQLQIQSIDHSLTDAQNRITHSKNVIAENEKDMELLRQRMLEAHQAEFEYKGATDCPTCGQELPADKVAEAKEKAEADFNRSKSKTLEHYRAEGLGFKEANEKFESTIKALQEQIEKLTVEKEAASKQVASLQADIDGMVHADTPDITARADYQKATQEKEAILQQIASLETQQQGVIKNLQVEANVIVQDVLARERNLVKLDQSESGRQRVKELTAQEEKLGAEYERLQGELFLTEEFIRTKVNLLEERINSKFKMARFKLFEQQINGGVNECCETMYQGVPYSGGLNNAARINVGLDIINTLSEHFGFRAPIFVDNAEAVTQLIETSAQVISLVVSAEDKALRVESTAKELKEAI